MFENPISIIFLVFIVFSFLGYVAEVILCTYEQKKFVNRGFLFGPYCPIYGVGALMILWTLLRYKEDPIIVFIVGVLITASIEYYTSYVLEKIFHNKWWDYSDRRDNINGRICVGNCIAFGVGACATIYVIYPILLYIFSKININTINYIAIVIAILFIIDLIWSITIAYNLRNRLIIAEELKAEKLKMLPIFIEKKFREQLQKIHRPTSRLLKAFPDLKIPFNEELEMIRKWVIKNTDKNKKN